jgi:non-canonical purine NTP pyrophosphatase (RdgB/HAM1 family)
MEVYLVTQNPGKLMAAQSIFDGTDIKLLAVNKDYPEIQANTSAEVAEHTSLQVAQELGKPALREDHSLFLNGLNGVPGPYMNYFDKKISEDDLLKIFQNIDDRTGYFEVATILAFPDGKLLRSNFQVKFSLATEARGDLQSGWNKLIVLDGETRTLAEYPETERVEIWQQGYKSIKEQLETV